ncbi:MAG: acyltransferase family protein [Hyphomicrobiaceae bacterium]
MQYRKDIDGLRAVAVLAVVLFHAKVPGFSGGFVGVDVFFVISGFLITGLIASEVERGHFSFASFYHRRVRRIVPALLAVYVASTVLGALLMLPRDMAEYGRSLLSSALFVSNVFFFNQAGYFDGPSELKPLLHTWSLSIEEQFYLAWPILLLLAVRWRQKAMPYLVWLVGGLSVVGFIVVAHINKEAAFFATPLRAWELMLGASLALMPVRSRLSVLSAELCAGTGLALIVAATTSANATHPLAVLAALPACLGAALVVHAGASHPQAGAIRLLSAGPVVAVGLLSYSLYLWHWPLFAFARYASDRLLDWQETSLLICLSLVAAFLSYRLVEQPARHIDFARMRPVVGGGLLALGAFALLGQQINRFGGWTFNLDPEIRRLDATARADNIYRGKCHGENNAFRNEDLCTFGASRRGGSYDLVIFGDSHADHFTPALAKLSAQAGLSGRQVTVGGCLALLGYHEIISPYAKEPRCRALREAIPRFVKENAQLQMVVLAHHWSIYLGTDVYSDEGHAPFYLLGVPEDERSEARSLEVLRQSLEQTLDFFATRDIQVILLGEVPPLGRDPLRCISASLRRGHGTDTCNRSIAEVRGRLDKVNHLLTDLAARRKKVSFLSPLDSMCDQSWCSPIVKGVYMYRDGNHLNRIGAELLSQSMFLPGLTYRTELEVLRKMP